MAAAVSTENDTSKLDQSSMADSQVSAPVAQIKTQEPFRVSPILDITRWFLRKADCCLPGIQASFFLHFPFFDAQHLPICGAEVILDLLITSTSNTDSQLDQLIVGKFRPLFCHAPIFISPPVKLLLFPKSPVNFTH